MTSQTPEMNQYLRSTAIIDSDHETMRSYAAELVAGTDSPVERAVKLFYAVRDNIAYEFIFPHLASYYRSSLVLARRKGFCVSKAALLCALARAAGIPSRVCFANVRNHLANKQVREYVGSDVFVYHGMTEFYLEEKWVKATPAFNLTFCEKSGVEPLDFNGREDSIFQAYDVSNRKYMEYIRYHGCFTDIPVGAIVDAWISFYGERRVGVWMRDANDVIAPSLERV